MRNVIMNLLFRCLIELVPCSIERERESTTSRESERESARREASLIEYRRKHARHPEDEDAGAGGAEEEEDEVRPKPKLLACGEQNGDEWGGGRRTQRRPRDRRAFSTTLTHTHDPKRQ